MARRLWGPTRRLCRRPHRLPSRRYRARVSGPLPSAASRSKAGRCTGGCPAHGPGAKRRSPKAIHAADQRREGKPTDPTTPGVKSPDLIRDFIQAAKQ